MGSISLWQAELIETGKALPTNTIHKAVDTSFALLPLRVFLLYRHHSHIWLAGMDPGWIRPRKYARRHRDTRHDYKGA
jgi:hypothetical protein